KFQISELFAHLRFFLEDVFQIDVLNEINEELDEIKDEPVTDLSDFKCEEPIADIYCPSSATSLSPDQSTSRIITDAPSSIKRTRKCVVCKRSNVASEMHTFTSNQGRRVDWVNAVRVTTEEREALMEELSTMKYPLLCASHFSSSDYFKRKASHNLLRYDAIPFFSDSTANSCGVEHTHNSGVTSIQKASRSKCVVCSRLCKQREMHRFTMHHSKRPRWINAVRSTPEGRRSLAEQLDALKQPSLCASHFSPSDYINNGYQTILRFDAVPGFDNSVEDSGEVEDVRESDLGINDIKKEPA
ncbi:hypothetical protein PMAYCL1PPCAC_08293, partial [Pristionchus mayeri]